MKSALTPGGTIIFSVPDTEPCQAYGDASMLLHEHWSYFTKHSLHKFMMAVGDFVSHVVYSSFGGSLYGVANRQNISGASLLAEDVMSSSYDEARYFVRRMDSLNSRLAKFIGGVRERGKSLAIYVPIRALNSLRATSIDSRHIRFIDDNPALHGTYFPGFKQVVEGRDALVNHPTDEVLIMSHTFGNKIKRSLQKILPASTHIVLLTDLGEK